MGWSLSSFKLATKYVSSPWPFQLAYNGGPKGHRYMRYTFKKGHKIRLEVSSSSFPRFSRNANSRIQPEFAKEEDLRPATQTIYHDSSHLSQLVLPEVE